ncbi:hypothetical protein F5Y06DRAFT_305092 [Hypoxylon sp. FL0890]|nr:hypothetical protein F5Y06DRAFT_305092 [Hypoxylon sp. FL0890]
MRLPITSLCRLAPLLLYSAKLSSAFMVHSSCNGKDFDRAKLVQAIEDAFLYAADAVDYWDNNEAQDLKSWLFGSSAAGAKKFFDNLISDASVTVENQDSNADIATEKVVFFCSTDVLKTEKDPVENNPNNPSGSPIITNTVVNIRAYGDPKDCEPKFLADGVKAFTARQNGRSYIMICPWYLEQMKVGKVPTAKGFKALLKSSVRALDKGLDKIIPDAAMTGMDTMALLEQTMLHELTHTAYGGGAADIASLDSYGWENVRKLSSNPNAYKNAESLAFFGLGANLMRGPPSYVISENGDIKQKS